MRQMLMLPPEGCDYPMPRTQEFEDVIHAFLSRFADPADPRADGAGGDAVPAFSEEAARAQIEEENRAIRVSAKDAPVLQASAMRALASNAGDGFTDAVRAAAAGCEASVGAAEQRVEAALASCARARDLMGEFTVLQEKKGAAEQREAESRDTLAQAQAENAAAKFSPNVLTAICALGVLYCGQLSFRPGRLNELLGLNLPGAASSIIALVAALVFAGLILAQFKSQKSPDAAMRDALASAQAEASAASRESAMAMKELLDFDYEALKSALSDANEQACEAVAALSHLLER